MWILAAIALALRTFKASGVVISSGEDYWLPEDVGRSAGFFRPGTVIDPELAGMIDYSFGTYYWSQINPTDGVFDFSMLLSKLQEASNTNRGFIMRLKVAVINRKTGWDDSDAPYIPQWVLDVCQPATCYTAGSSSSNSFFHYAVLWDGCVQQKYQSMCKPLWLLESSKALLLLAYTLVA